MYFTSGQDRAFERLMQEKPGFDHYDGGGADAPEDCGTCRFYRPDWKYQFCQFAECPYQPGKLTALAAVKFTVKGADDDMAVFRVEKNKGYTVMSNHHLRNKALSLKAKGLLSQMLSLPEDWDYTLKGLSLINRESIDAIRTAVWELERAGYIRREQGRDAKGKMADMVYTIYEQPVLDKPVLENPVLENPTSDNPTSDNPASGNPTQLNKEIQRTNLPRKEKLNTDGQSTDSIPFPSLTPAPVEDEAAAAPPERKGTGKDAAVQIYREILLENIEYDYLIQDSSIDREQLDEIVDLMLETVCTSRKTIRIAGDSLYMSTLGNRPDLFSGSQYPHASTLKEPTYYDVPPEALEDERFAAMLKEAEKYIGYPYVWGGSSPSTSFDCSGFISWVINHSGWNVGRLGAQGLYNICTPVSSSQAKPGDLVFFVGTYDTPGVSHVGLYVGNSVMLHCGDPISYTNLNSNYWQSHFYSFRRLP